MVSRRTIVVGGAAVAVAGVAGAAGYRVWQDREPAAPAMQDDQGRLVWRNWSGIEHSYPAKRAAPASLDELSQLMKSTTGPIRPVGAGHSFTALVPTDGTLVTLDRMSGLVSHDAQKLEATFRAGTRLAEVGPALSAIGQEMPNLPDINKQSLAGGIGTGTHGTGKTFRALHAEVTAFELVTPGGEVLICDAARHGELFQAARVGMGAFGIISQMSLRNQPLVRVKKVVTIRDMNEVMEDWPELIGRHRNVEFYIVPFTGYAIVITHDETQEAVTPRGPDNDVDGLMQLKGLRDWLSFAPGLRKSLAQQAFKDTPPDVAVDEGWKLLSNERPVKFIEMEYHLPLSVQMTALREVNAAIEKHRPDVFFPIEARVIAPDDAWLSPFHERLSGSIAVHAYYKDDHQFLYDLIEPILRKHGGRPHWGKLHSLGASDLRGLYPKFDEAARLRAEIDPAGRMLNPFLKRVFGVS